MIRNPLCALTAVCLAACSAPHSLDAPAPGRVRVVAAHAPAPVPAAPAVARASPATTAALAAAQAKVDEAKRLIAGFNGSDASLAQAYRAAEQLNNPRAQSLAREAQTRAALALDGYYVTASAQELQRLYTITGLNDAQLDRLREAEVVLVRGEGARAHALLQQLNKELRSDRKHRVARGESLWSIAARPEVYANGFLWPLIWDANRDRIPDPNVLRQGQSLRIRPNPTVDEVVQAVETARARMAARVRIGKIREE